MSFSRSVSLALFGFILTVAAPQIMAAEATPEQILEQADRARFPAEDFQVDVSVTNSAPGKETDLHQYQIMSKGNTRTLVVTVAPPAERGQVLLMKERDLWVYMPNVSQPVRLPLAQRLTGLVSYGDIARANFRGDYTPKLLRTEDVGGQAHWLLELNAVDKSVTYHRVLLWVNQSNYRPYKAEFYAVSGRHMKTAYYQNFQPMGGMLRPSRLLMEDAVRKGEKSVMEYANMAVKEIPEKLFTKDYLKKLQ